jgi:hypothetical protein
MTTSHEPSGLVVNTLTTIGFLLVTVNPVITQGPSLRIVVVEGEDAVNVIQQKTAVAPVVEVRDRNDQPVAGALVRFAIGRGRATFNGARALTATTNAAGRAVATGLTPTGSGALQISATATFQGQTAVATIAQTNVMTAASASTAAGGGSAGAGGSASGSGGLSATTIGIVGGAVAGGAIAAKEVIASKDDSSDVDAAWVGAYILATVDGAAPPVFIHPSTVNCPVFLESGRLTLGSNGSYDLILTETFRCILPPINVGNYYENGAWRKQSDGHVTFSPRGPSQGMTPATVEGATLSNTLGVSTNEPTVGPKTVSATWQKQ